ncbi:hypothetical protein GCM10020229_32350 [Kitasatospora albolonga]|uniref:WhiB family transcriptional regulator n=1 Tax=Kitasatospora albolonga TaxID=68173 RepID=UPI0031F14868
MTVVSRLPGAFEHEWDWQLRAACRTVSTDLFFTPLGERGPEREAREASAKEVCARCPVREACLRHALLAHETYGVWGGQTEDERERLFRASRRRRRAAA